MPFVVCVAIRDRLTDADSLHSTSLSDHCWLILHLHVTLNIVAQCLRLKPFVSVTLSVLTAIAGETVCDIQQYHVSICGS